DGTCQTGWTIHGDSCYIYNSDPYSWFDSREACEAIGGHLVDITSAAENTFLVHMVRGQGHAWIGLEDIAVEGEFVWSHSRQPAEYTNWGAAEPTNVGGHEDCALLRIADGHWQDIDCKSQFPSLCESSEMRGVLQGRERNIVRRGK
ncbi:hypothetical protein BaRGS_00013970, partial [Batillaria attramentaria]